MNEPLLAMKGIRKRFGRHPALRGVDFHLRAGEVHALLGENGAGKSTLMKILYGLYLPDAGEIRLGGRPALIRRPADSIALGVGMVHQHFMLVEPFTVAENLQLALGEGVAYRPGEAARRAEALARRFGLDLDPGARVGDLALGVRQRVEILKALARDARILVLDEPTAVLAPQEVSALFAALERLRAGGRAVILTTHKLGEALAVSDRITVLRAGRVVGVRRPRETDPDELVSLIVGEERAREGAARPRGAAPRAGPPLLEVAGLSAPSDRGGAGVVEASLEVRPGEIVGVAGVDGNGQVELAEAIMGIRPLSGGAVRLSGEEVTAGRSPGTLRAAGVAYIPPDRRRDALVPAMTVAENLVLDRAGEGRFRRGPFLRMGRIREFAETLIRDFDIRTPSPEEPAGRLSGGNQQKLVLARTLADRPSLLIAVNPTWGVDVGAAAAIRRAIAEIPARGGGVLLFSTELEEIYALADRILVMHRRRIAGERTPAAAREEVGRLMMGGEAAPAARPGGAPA